MSYIDLDRRRVGRGPGVSGRHPGRAYLLKERVSDPEQLVSVIREVARGGSVIDPKMVERLVAGGAR